MDTAQWPQGIGVVKPMEGSISRSQPMLERRSSAERPQKDQVLNCPRCNSTNTKFCYYNNYSLSQPRYFCKTCRRYWTEGGSLRNVPVGGGLRKNKRSSSTTSSSSSTSRKLNSNIVDHLLTTPASFSHSASQNSKIYEGQDLNLAYHPPISNTDHHRHQDQDYNNLSSEFVEAPPYNNLQHQIQNPSSNSSVTTTSRGLNLMSSFMQMPIMTDSNTMYSSSGFPFQELKQTLNFSLDGFDNQQNGYGSTSFQARVLQENGSGTAARLLFPVEDIKSVSTSTEFEQNRGQLQGDSSGGYWSGMLGGGSW